MIVLTRLPLPQTRVVCHHLVERLRDREIFGKTDKGRLKSLAERFVILRREGAGVPVKHKLDGRFVSVGEPGLLLSRSEGRRENGADERQSREHPEGPRI